MPAIAPTLDRPLPRLPQQKHKRVGPYSRKGALALLDGRSREAQFMKTRRGELVAHVGGAPNAIQTQMIERAVRLSLHLELMDVRLAAGRRPTPHDRGVYIAWQNSLTRTLHKLDQMSGVSRRKTRMTKGSAIGPHATIADLLAGK